MIYSDNAARSIILDNIAKPQLDEEVLHPIMQSKKIASIWQGRPPVHQCIVGVTCPAPMSKKAPAAPRHHRAAARRRVEAAQAPPSFTLPR